MSPRALFTLVGSRMPLAILDHIGTQATGIEGLNTAASDHACCIISKFVSRLVCWILEMFTSKILMIQFSEIAWWLLTLFWYNVVVLSNCSKFLPSFPVRYISKFVSMLNSWHFYIRNNPDSWVAPGGVEFWPCYSRVSGLIPCAGNLKKLFIWMKIHCLPQNS